jgi:hypothetical protein
MIKFFWIDQRMTEAINLANTLYLYNPFAGLTPGEFELDFYSPAILSQRLQSKFYHSANSYSLKGEEI